MEIVVTYLVARQSIFLNENIMKRSEMIEWQVKWHEQESELGKGSVGGPIFGERETLRKNQRYHFPQSQIWTRDPSRNKNALID